MIRKSTSLSVLFYALTLIFLGWVAYQEKASLVSLYMGIGSGVGLLFCSIGMWHQKKGCLSLSLGLTLALCAVFFFRYQATGKSIPAYLTVLSLILFIVQIFQLRDCQKN